MWLMSTNRNNRPQNVEEITKKLSAINIDDEQTELLVNKDKEIGEIDEETIIPSKDTIEREVDIKIVQEDRTQSSSDTKTSKFIDVNESKGCFIIVILGFLIYIVTYNLVQCSFSNSSKSPAIDTDSIVEVVDSVVDVIDYDYNSPLGKCKYTGSFDENNKPHGRGKATFSDGRYYEGFFVNGDLSGDNAIFKYPNGDEFRGTFKNNAFYEGTYTIKEDGSYFTGTFKNGQPDKGTWYDKNGKIID